MKLCNEGHEEVCYESKYCPVCEKEKEIQEQEKIIKSLEEEIIDIRYEVDTSL